MITNRKIGNSIYSFFLMFFSLLFIIVFLPVREAFDRNIFIAIQFLFIGLISIFAITIESNKRPYSLVLMMWFYIFMFMFCAGLTQFGYNDYLWGLTTNNSEVITANFLILIWEIIFLLKLPNFGSKSKVIKRILSKDVKVTKTNTLILGFILSIFALYLVYKYGFSIIFFRSTYSVALSNISDSSGVLSIVATLRNGLVLTLILYSLTLLKRKMSISNLLIMSIVAIISVILVPPTGVARYVVATIYGGVLIYYFEILKKGRIFLIGILVGLLIIFPLLNTFRGLYTTELDSDFIKNTLGDITNNFLEPDYDSYTTLLYTVKFVSDVGVTWGEQLLGTVFFFVPRSIWESKPVGSGAMMIEHYNPDIPSNVSCSIIGEGNINFGIFGVLLFGIFLKKVFKFLDNLYWSTYTTESSKIVTIIYPCLILYSLFMSRGDLMSTYSFLFGFVFVFSIVFTLTNFIQKIYVKIEGNNNA